MTGWVCGDGWSQYGGIDMVECVQWNTREQTIPFASFFSSITNNRGFFSFHVYFTLSIQYPLHTFNRLLSFEKNEQNDHLLPYHEPLHASYKRVVLQTGRVEKVVSVGIRFQWSDVIVWTS